MQYIVNQSWSHGISYREEDGDREYRAEPRGVRRMGAVNAYYQVVPGCLGLDSPPWTMSFFSGVFWG